MVDLDVMEPFAVLLPHFVVCCTFHAVDSAGSMEMLRREKQLRGWPAPAVTEEDAAGVCADEGWVCVGGRLCCRARSWFGSSGMAAFVVGVLV